ncbi:LysR family transcriptional regulator [Maritimibacter sp. UBA3975]|uniref:LysR family transcriptional regulator n=1 Tax=Maritimibacter sp. UBA3975 TaxID=1946833 RepID=UPI000C0A7B87|nr:LysR family transcriptional regulator [Maritimibacter sp. UBA3975]MAM63400.1 LysR family transcriptional regulator [Maritimibacter sp.]|tara:strand:- start:79231 stop:80112 length:882 start_codon:yes stop_codon:yes gene_type:complete
MDWSRIPSLAALRAFEALSRHGTLSAAARDLNVTHAAIAQHLRTLETHFGEGLASRDGQTMRLTETGRELADALGDGFSRISEGVGAILDRNAIRPITVTLTPSFAEVWLMPRMGQFWAKHPDVEVRLVPSVGLADLRRDGIDLAIRFGTGAWPGYEVEPLAVSRFAVVAAPDYTKARSIEELGRLGAYDWYFSSAANEQRIWGRTIGIDFERIGAQDMANNGMVLSAVRAGLGLSIQSLALVEPDISSGQLTTLYEGDPEGLGYYVLTRPGVLTPGARTFRTWLRRMAQAQA